MHFFSHPTSDSYLQGAGFFLVQSIIIYTVGIKTYQHMAASGTANGVNGLVCFLVCAPLVTVLAEVFYRIVDLPSIVAARGFWAFMTQ